MIYEDFLELMKLNVIKEQRGVANDPDSEGKPLMRIHQATVESEDLGYRGDIRYKTLGDGSNHMMHVSLFFNG